MELVILMGLQGAGKSTFYRARLAATHVLVSKDQFPNARNRDRRQHRLVAEALGAGRDVAVDNTNATVAARAELLALARTHGARTVGYYFASDVEACLARNRQREGKARVPDVALFATLKQLTRPTHAEGFDALFHVTMADDGFTVSDWHAPREAP